jgi:hypothetical protein
LRAKDSCASCAFDRGVFDDMLIIFWAMDVFNGAEGDEN